MFKKYKIERLFYKKYPFKVLIYGTGDTKFYEFRYTKEIMEKYEKGEIRFRYTSIFIKDRSTYDDVVNKLQNCIAEVWEPGSEQEEQFLHENSHKKHLVDQLKWKKFRFKVQFDRMKLRSDNYIARLREFVKNNKAQVKPKPMLEKLLKSPKQWYWIGIDLYVEDDKTLVKLLMTFTDIVVRVDEYVLRSGINTLTEVENASIEPTTTILSD